MIKRVNYDRLFAGIVTMNTALARNGLVYFSPVYLDIASKAACSKSGIMRYLNTNTDTEHYTRPSKDNPNLLIPTRERALVDYMLYQDEYGDEGLLIEALQNYLEQFKDMDKLYEVADFYKLPRETVDYWIKEAEEETSMSMG